ncbi:hypothetical protein T492DRAFT_888591 [Pavlovales sp. CCMP2436]|nr:hypothetical protein T492DRAFT_888591 [Pavlovales sp. CCMP2436]
MGKRFSLPTSLHPDETPSPMDYSPSTNSLERTKMRRAPAAIFDSPIDAKDAADAVPDPGARLPGPADYDVGKWRTDSSFAYSFGGAGVRNRRSVAKRADVTPGPASYYASTNMLSKGLSF